MSTPGLAASLMSGQWLAVLISQEDLSQNPSKMFPMEVGWGPLIHQCLQVLTFLVLTKFSGSQEEAGWWWQVRAGRSMGGAIYREEP